MQCSRFRTALSARADGEALPPGITGPALDEHLAACAECRRFADGIGRLRDAVRASDDGSEGDPAAADALLARVRAETEGRTGRRTGDRTDRRTDGRSDGGCHGLGGTRAG
ncbi:zf-HC2 domain-containing protein [Streptomyces sp. NPDC047108]|uniref:zf-HC2 domain-containing protein n=1 Tax=Streptomyces sp. NPDC047108 TaxID=3155025 RepID=UPI0034033D7B